MILTTRSEAGGFENSFDALRGFLFLNAVLPGSFRRSAICLAARLLIASAFAALNSRAEDQPGSGSAHDKSGDKKHYLTFQIGYVGTASEISQDEYGRRERTLEVADRFSGRIEFRPSEGYDLPTNQSAEAQLLKMAAMQAAALAGDADKMKAVTPGLLVSWFPVGDEVEITGEISELMTTRTSEAAHGETRASTGEGIESYDCQKVFAGSVVNAFVKIRAEEEHYDFQFTLMPDMATTMEAVHQRLVSDHTEEGHNTHTESEAKVPLDMGPGQMALGYSNYMIAADVKGLALAGEANELIGTSSIPVPKPAGWTGPWHIFLEVSWQIDVSPPPVDLVITVPGYAGWRPKGSIKTPEKPGNNLTAVATLVPKKGHEDFVPKVANIQFQLLETSSEPGVCMNWPLNAQDHDFDLRLAPLAGGTLSQSDQKLLVADPGRDKEGHPFATTQIDSYDFGGRATLRATCTLKDGRKITGVLKGNEDGKKDVLLPKRAKDDWIAEQWRKENKVGDVAADDDSEEVEGNPYKGDGYTLYEEYRGFAERGRLIEGDPKKKDLCILNLIGSDAWPGIHMFEAATGLRAIHKLLPSEMSEKERLMNGNHRAAPHVVDQHGIFLSKPGTHPIPNGGAMTYYIQDLVQGRPALIRRIDLPAQDDKASDFGKPWNLPTADQAVAYDRAVAHELAHGVGAMHHGVGDLWVVVRYLPASDPRNNRGKASFFVGDSGEFGWIQVLHEKSKEDLLVREGPLMESALQAMLGNFPGYAELPADQREEMTNMLTAYKWYAGAKQGECSGNEQCLMRYYFAQVYEKDKDPTVLYLVEPGTEDVGAILCPSAEGTNCNGKDHDPQPRYFGADTDLDCGNCRAQICPNDLIPPRPRQHGL